MHLPDKIYIIGGSGSGKTSLAQKISAIKHIPHFDLDDITRLHKYTKKLPLDQRKHRLQSDILHHHKKWIIEGFAVDRVGACYQEADLVIILDVPGWKSASRVLGRYVSYILHKDAIRTFWGVMKLIRWALKYHNPKNPYSLHRLVNDCKKYKCDYVVIRDTKELFD